MKKLLLIIDVQQAFINKYTKSLPEKIEKYVSNNFYDYIALSKFVNNLNSNYYKKLKYKNCINDEQTKIVLKNINYNIVIEKSTYSAYNDKLANFINDNKIDEIYICGLDTDACVLKTALDLFERNYNVYVLKNYCASSSGRQYHNMAIKILSVEIGKNSII